MSTLLQKDSPLAKENHPNNQQICYLHSNKTPENIDKMPEYDEQYFNNVVNELSVAEETATENYYDLAADDLSASDFQDAISGEPMKKQIIRLDFSPVEGTDDNEEVLKKCHGFWEFLKGHTELHHWKVVPEKHRKHHHKPDPGCLPPDSEVSTEQYVVKDEAKISEMSATDWMKRDDIMNKALKTLDPQRYCEHFNEDYCDARDREQRHKAARKRRSRLASINPPSTSKVNSTGSGGRNHSVSSTEGRSTSPYNVADLVSQMKAWDWQHMKSMDPPHFPHAMSKMTMLRLDDADTGLCLQSNGDSQDELLSTVLHPGMPIRSGENFEVAVRILHIVGGMPPEMAISMRYTKLKAAEAALIAGELTKPTWESRNEGIHERVSFEDTLWGFNLAGGAYYKTPLRVTFVKPESRAEKAGIKAGDQLLRINGVDTSTLTIQEAHQIIVDSGIHIKLSVTSPDDLQDSFYYYEDPTVADYEIEEQRRLEEEKARKRRVRAKVSSYWSLQWPWVSRRRPIYRESNCFMVNSKYEEERREKYPVRPSQRYFDDIILFNDDDKKEVRSRQPSERGPKQGDQNGGSEDEEFTNGEITEDEEVDDANISTIVEQDEDILGGLAKNVDSQIEDITEVSNSNEEHDAVLQENEKDVMNLVNHETNNTLDYDASNENESNDTPIEESNLENKNAAPHRQPTPRPHLSVNRLMSVEGKHPIGPLNNDINNENDDNVLDEVLGKSDSNPRNDDDDNILDSILSDEGQNLENSESVNER